MKEKIKIKTIVCCLMMTSMLLGLGACNNEDDVMEIFNNKTWKLVRIATEKGNIKTQSSQTYPHRNVTSSLLFHK